MLSAVLLAVLLALFLIVFAMTRPKRKKNNVNNSNSDDSTQLVNIEEQNKQMDTILQRLEQLESKLKQNGDANTERLIESIQRLESTVFELQVEQDRLKREVKELKEERQILVEEVETTKSNLNFVIEKNNELEQYNRGNNIRVFGIRDVKREEKAVETEKTVRELIRNKLGYKLDDSDIEVAHRLGSYQSNKDRAVIVRFSSRKVTEQVTSRRRALKGSGIVIAEDLTKINAARYQKVRELSAVVRAWTKRGEIYALGQNGRVLKKPPSMELSQFSRVLTDQGSAPHRTTPHQGVRQGPSYAMPATRREPARQERPSAGPEAAEDAARDVSAIFPSRESVRPTEYGATGPRASTPRQQGEEMVGLGQEGTTAVQERLLDMAKD